MKYRPPDETKYWRIYLGFTALSSAVDYLILVLYFDYRRTYFLEYGTVYAVISCLVVLVLTYSPLRERLLYKVSLIAKLLVVAINCLANLAVVTVAWKSTMASFMRYITGPLAGNFLLMSALIIAHDVLMLISNLWTSTTSSSYTSSSSVDSRKVFGVIGLLFYRLMALRRYDRLMKLDYVSQERLETEMSASNEKLVLLMPKFVLDRINYLEMSNNFVADDAGEVCVLFCDICEFDGVIDELQDQVVSLLDDVFRKFDGFCKVRGVQKIEVITLSYLDGWQNIHGMRRAQVPRVSTTSRSKKILSS